MNSNDNNSKLTLVSKEGEKIQVDAKITEMCGLLRDMIEDNEELQEEIELLNIDHAYLVDIVRYCEHFNFKKEVNIPKPLPSSNLSVEI